MWTGRPV